MFFLGGGYMDIFFCSLRWSGSEEEFILYCLYFPALFFLAFIIDFFIAISAVTAEKVWGKL
jgi:hypothetical protein